MSVRFDAATGERLERTTNLPNLNSTYTIMGWFFISVDQNDEGTLLFTGSSSTNYDSCYLTSDGTTLTVECANAGSGSATGTNLTVNRWYHIAMVRNSATSLQIYLNGVSNATATFNVTTGRAANDVLNIGNSIDFTNDNFNGCVRSFKQFSTNLGASDIVAEMVSDRAVRATNLVAWTPLKYHTDLTDYSGNGNNWTEVGTTSTNYATPYAPQFQAAGTADSQTIASSPAWPTHVAGDVALLVIESAGGEAATLSTAAGFVAVTNSPQATGAGTAGTQLTVFWCRATSSAMGAPTIADPGDHVHAQIITFRGCISSGDPWSTTAGSVKASASTTTTFPSVDTRTYTSTPEQLIVLIAARDNDSATAAWSGYSTGDGNSTVVEHADTGTALGNGGGIVVASHGWHDPASTGSFTATVTSSINAQMTIALRPNEVAITQAEAAFYEDGTESGSSVIDSGADSITRDLSGGDSNLQLRIRLQDTGAVSGQYFDDYQLQYELNDSGTYIDVNTVGAFDSYSESNRSSAESIGNGAGATTFRGQAMTGTGEILTSAQFFIQRSGSPTGNVTAVVYASTGSFGTNMVGTGAALATSDPVDITTIATSYTLTSFTFSGGNLITLSMGTNYVLGLEYSAGTAGAFLQIGTDNSSPTHGGNRAAFQSPNWTAAAGIDVPFYAFGAVHVQGYNSGSLTDGEVSTNRLGSGSGSFITGEVSEDGLVDDVQMASSNYFELVYSLTLVSAQLADGDTIDFRVIRNDVTTGMTYTVTPRITIDNGSPPATPSSATLMMMGI